MGGAIVAMFAIKYPSYVSMIGLLAPPGKFYVYTMYIKHIQMFVANEHYETELIKELRTGVYTALIPETPEQLYSMINKLTVKQIRLPRPFLNGFLDLRLRLLEEHKKGNVLATIIYIKIFTIYYSNSNFFFDQ